MMTDGRPHTFRTARWMLALLLGAWSAPATAGASLFDLIYDAQFSKEVFEPFHHTHLSDSGTPLIHPFTIEPPQNHRDAFLIYTFAQNTEDGHDEFEAEVHVDWALTRRLGIFVGLPMVGLDEPGGALTVGPGDLEIAPRITWVERGTFVMASNLVFTVPTGDTSRGLGAGEVVISPFVTTWHDLGRWTTLFLNAGPEIGATSGDVSMHYGFSLARSWSGLAPGFADDDGGRTPTAAHHHDTTAAAHERHRNDGAHFPPGLFTLHNEIAGATELGGERRTFLEWLPGISYAPLTHVEFRFGVRLPVSGPRQYDHQYYAALTWIPEYAQN